MWGNTYPTPMAAPDIILVTGKGYLSRYDQRQQNWHQVVPLQGDPDNANLVRLMILQNTNGFCLKAVHDANGSVSMMKGEGWLIPLIKQRVEIFQRMSKI